jgi:hypothetical protein
MDVSFLDVLRDYFRGERLEALVFMCPIGMASVAFSLMLLKADRNAFTWAVAVPFFVLGLALLGTGAAVGLRTPSQVEGLTQLYSNDLGAFAAQELARMKQVNAMWPVYLSVWTAFAAVGLLLRFGIHREWALGLGIALLFFAGVGFMIDGFAERRARPYTAALEALRPRGE